MQSHQLAARLHESNSNHFERLPSAQGFVSVSKSLIQVIYTHKIIGPFFNHNPAFGFQSDSENDADSEVDEEPEALGVNGGEKSRSRAKDSSGKESNGMSESVRRSQFVVCNFNRSCSVTSESISFPAIKASLGFSKCWEFRGVLELEPISENFLTCILMIYLLNLSSKERTTTNNQQNGGVLSLMINEKGQLSVLVAVAEGRNVPVIVTS